MGSNTRKFEKRVCHARSEYQELTAPWHRNKPEGKRYYKRQHSKALRNLGKALVVDEQFDEVAYARATRGRKSAETKAAHREKWRNWGVEWKARFASDSVDRLSARKRDRARSYARFCRDRCSAYWRKFVC